MKRIPPEFAAFRGEAAPASAINTGERLTTTRYPEVSGNG